MIKSFLMIILKHHSWCDLGLSLQEIIPRVSTRQGLLFQRYKCKLTRSVISENTVRQASRVNASEGENHNFYQIAISNPNPEYELLLNRNLLILRWSSLHTNFFLNLFIHFYFEYYYFISHYYIKYYYVQIG